MFDIIFNLLESKILLFDVNNKSECVLEHDVTLCYKMFVCIIVDIGT